ncbi:MAG TPA: hypothetical protein VJN42_00105 [Candidatus Acidoferrum sp.]|nr:hypothetical protein [Candidatus Acidoferrum sp.]
MPDQPAGDAVGVIDGADIAITGPMSVDMVGGQVKTILRSGSDVVVKSGRARISLVESGQIAICGPAHFSVLKAGGSLTLALESGIVRMRVDQAPEVTVYTAQIQAHPFAVGENLRDFLVGFENPRVMCIRTFRGAMRLEQQLSGQSVTIPQGGDILLVNGQMDAMQNGAGHCQCDLEVAKAAALPPLPPVPASPSPLVPTAPNSSNSVAQDANTSTRLMEPSTPNAQPVYTVSLPPLTYDATAAVQAAPDPRLMAIARKVRVRPTLIFQGVVEGEPVATAAVVPTSPPPRAAAPSGPAQGSMMDRVRAFLRRLLTRGG